MGSGAAYHGGSLYSEPSWDEMTPAQKEAYLEQQRQAKKRQAQYEKQEKTIRIIKIVFIVITVAVLLGLLIALICWLAPAFKAGWELGQQMFG